jgi:four helix bundle protein
VQGARCKVTAGRNKMEFYFEKLNVWQEAMNLVERIYKLTARFPKEEQFGLITQLRRAAISIPSNIAEGQGRYHRKEFVQFLYNSRGSLYEVITQLKIAERLKYLAKTDIETILQECHSIESKLSGLINSMKDKL